MTALIDGARFLAVLRLVDNIAYKDDESNGNHLSVLGLEVSEHLVSVFIV